MSGTQFCRFLDRLMFMARLKDDLPFLSLSKYVAGLDPRDVKITDHERTGFGNPKVYRDSRLFAAPNSTCGSHWLGFHLHIRRSRLISPVTRDWRNAVIVKTKVHRRGGRRPSPSRQGLVILPVWEDFACADNRRK